jgi:hypothetical protein
MDLFDLRRIKRTWAAGIIKAYHPRLAIRNALKILFLLATFTYFWSVFARHDPPLEIQVIFVVKIEPALVTHRTIAAPILGAVKVHRIKCRCFEDPIIILIE